MQFSSKKKKGGRFVNIAVIGLIALLAAGLIAAWQGGLFQSDREGMTQQEIEAQMEQMDRDKATAAPTASPDDTAVQTEEASARPTEAPGYVFIILNNRVWGIEALGEERDVTVDQGDGVVNVIHLLPDGYYMQSSTCDNQLCVGEGTVTVQNYQTRILGPCVYCLPHNLQLELVVPGATRDPNAPDI